MDPGPLRVREGRNDPEEGARGFFVRDPCPLPRTTAPNPVSCVGFALRTVL